MQRRPTKNTRGPNFDEKAFQAWLKNHSCCGCGAPAPSIVDHCEGSTFKHNKVLVGHWFCIPLCASCDRIKTLGNHNWQREHFGWTNSVMWLGLVNQYTGNQPPIEVVESIRSWYR